MSLWLIKEIHALYHHHVSITKEINEEAAIQIMTTYIVALANTLILRIEITITCWTIESYHFFLAFNEHYLNSTKEFYYSNNFMIKISSHKTSN